MNSPGSIRKTPEADRRGFDNGDADLFNSSELLTMAPSPQNFPKSEHLRRPADFRRVYDRHCSVRADLLTLYACPNDLDHTRIGFSVSRKVGGAVLRNRLRRLYREAYRLVRERLPRGLDFVIIPRGPIEPDLQYLKDTLVTLAAELARKLANGKKPS
jgi:ribonuclease P protein component